MGLSVAGGLLGTHVAPNEGRIGDILRKTSAGVYGFSYLLLVFTHLRCWSERWELRHHRRKLLMGVFAMLPFLGVRIAYQILAAFSSRDLFGLQLSSNPILPQFQPVTGKWIYYLILGVVFEVIVAVVYLLSSTVLSRRHRH
ncbi:unnamed protein product [Mycena citricolor]|uniref:DUF7702 domain-containing protein n=2 Tax=Mycena citricolor TaxID=2018698 RepID=A0AAD2HRV2_9AGAR|nr:unnamed protein product [Mycena citricolor]